MAEHRESGPELVTQCRTRARYPGPRNPGPDLTAGLPGRGTESIAGSQDQRSDLPPADCDSQFGPCGLGAAAWAGSESAGTSRPGHDRLPVGPSQARPISGPGPGPATFADRRDLPPPAHAGVRRGGPHRVSAGERLAPCGPQCCRAVSISIAARVLLDSRDSLSTASRVPARPVRTPVLSSRQHLHSLSRHLQHTTGGRARSPAARMPWLASG